MGKQHVVDEPLQAVEIGDPRLEEVVEIARHRMGFEDRARLPYEIGEALGVGLGMATELHMHERRQREAERARIELGAISPDEPRLFERLAAARYLGLRKPHLVGELGAAQCAVALERIEQAQIEGVESLHVLEHNMPDNARKCAKRAAIALHVARCLRLARPILGHIVEEESQYGTLSA